MPLVADGQLDKLRLADGAESGVSIAVQNAPGVWGNSSGDPMYDTFIFAQNGSNLTATVTGLAPGRYHFYLYGHADPDVTGEQNSVFTLQAGTNTLGPIAQMGGSGWKAGNPWQERSQYVVFRDVVVDGGPAGGARSGARPEWRGRAERPADHLARHQPAALAGRRRRRRPRRPTPTSSSARSPTRGPRHDTEARFTVRFDVES